MSEKKPDSTTSAKSDETSFAEMLKASARTETRIKVGEVAEGKVISIGKENIFLDLGTRAEGMIDRDECMHKGQLTIQEGETIQVLVSAFRSGMFQCTSRLRQAGRSDPRQREDSPTLLMLREAFAKQLPVEGKVKAVNKGGFEVQVLGQKTFCPISQIERNYCQDPESHLEKTYTFLVMQYEEDGRNIVVGRKELLQAGEREKARLLWQDLQLNQVLEGTVTSVHDYGAFVDIGGVEGLLHVSEISYQKTLSAASVLQSGQKLNVAIIRLDQEKNKISLSLKALQTDPWIEALQTIVVGKEFSGVVAGLKPFGAFVELFPGVVGLLHISQLGTGRRVSHPREVLAVGQTVQVRILAVDNGQKTISLTMEEAEADFHDELSQFREKQENEQKGNATTMASLLDSAINKKKK